MKSADEMRDASRKMKYAHKTAHENRPIGPARKPRSVKTKYAMLMRIVEDFAVVSFFPIVHDIEQVKQTIFFRAIHIPYKNNY
ncbi:hypothetical protein [Paraburkholderia sp. J12]|uniref:hypothetical protein n=1 Tax=Paraburkholderia sp. J12 TaxID=2805432 RepID=UPI002ABDA50C|nr:hypothetical protein [Paraburkholderia sp. J12]